MAFVQDVGPRLIERAIELRPSKGHPAAHPVQIAHDLGIDVSLVLRPIKTRAQYQANCELRERPRILVYRHSPNRGVASVTPADEHLLSRRERFSIAHELGHCIAYKSYGLKPVSAIEDRREYWRQERTMNEFANTLLVPPWLSSRWTSQLDTLDATCVFRIRDWANDCRASLEVVVTALARDTQGLGFLKVAEGVRVKAERRVLIVLHSSSSSDVELPNLFSHIDDVDFVDSITGSAGVTTSPQCQVGSLELSDVQLAWFATTGETPSRRREFREAIQLSRVIYWICAFTGRSSSGDRQDTLGF